VEEIYRPLGMGRCGKDCPLVLLENFKPGSDIGAVVIPDLRCDSEIGGEECSPQLGDQLFLCVAFITPALAAEVAIEPGRMPGPVGCLVYERGVVALSVAEAFEGRKLDAIGTSDILIPCPIIKGLQIYLGI